MTSIIISLFVLVLLNLTVAFHPQPQHRSYNLWMSNKDQEKKRWEVGRFLKTARFYGTLSYKIPIVSGLIKKIRNRNIEPFKFKPGDEVWPSGIQPDSLRLSWGPLDDVVMGGASKSDLTPGNNFIGSWTGFTSTANSGGFAGLRTKPFRLPFDVSTCDGIAIKVRGDGQRYKLIIRDDEQWNGIAWSYSFDTNFDKSENDIQIPFSAFKPTRFARTVPFKIFQKETLTGIQFTLSKFEYDGDLNPSFKEGPFELNIDRIGFY